MSALSDLRARVEAATGRDRELDDAIWWPVRCLPNAKAYREIDGQRQYNVCYYFDELNGHEDWRPLGPYNAAPEYTRSLDAALALVAEKLPGACWRCERFGPSGIEAYGYPFWASVGLPGEQEAATANTPALALLAALLAALDAEPACGSEPFATMRQSVDDGPGMPPNPSNVEKQA